MKFTVDFERFPGCAYVRTSGVASVDGFRDMTIGVTSDPRHRAGITGIIDHRDLMLESLTVDDMQAIEAMTAAAPGIIGLSRIAFVTRDD